jgi:hypothetical protein
MGVSTTRATSRNDAPQRSATRRLYVNGKGAVAGAAAGAGAPEAVSAASAAIDVRGRRGAKRDAARSTSKLGHGLPTRLVNMRSFFVKLIGAPQMSKLVDWNACRVL